MELERPVSAQPHGTPDGPGEARPPRHGEGNVRTFRKAYPLRGVTSYMHVGGYKHIRTAHQQRSLTGFYSMAVCF